MGTQITVVLHKQELTPTVVFCSLIAVLCLLNYQYMVVREKEGGNMEALAWKQQTISWLWGKDAQTALLFPQLCDYKITILTGTLVVESTMGSHRNVEPFQTPAYIWDHGCHFKATCDVLIRNKLQHKVSSRQPI